MNTDYETRLANLREAILPARPTADYSTGLANLRRSLKVARKSLLSDAAYQAAKKAEADRAWRAHHDRAMRIVAASIGLDLR